MKTRTIIMIVAALCFTTWVNAEESNVKLMKVTDENLSINCLALNDFASRIGTTEEELTEYVHELFQQALHEADKKGEKGSDYFLKLEQYDLSEAGYPYTCFRIQDIRPFWNNVVPEFSVGEENANEKIPLRWMYPTKERQYNADNLHVDYSQNSTDRMILTT